MSRSADPVRSGRRGGCPAWAVSMAVLAALAGPAGPAVAAELALVELADLADEEPGRDLWSARLSVSPGPGTAAGEGVAVAFARGDGFEDLSLVGAEASSGWRAVVLPDVAGLSPGALEVFATFSDPSPRELEIRFVWTAPSDPEIATAVAVALPSGADPLCVPEPASGALAGAALATLLALRRQRRAPVRRSAGVAAAVLAVVGALSAPSARADVIALADRVTTVVAVGDLDLALTPTHVDRVGIGLFEVSVHVEATNRGAPLGAVGLSAFAAAEGATVLTGVVNLEALATDAVASADRSLVVRVDRRVPFDLASLEWEIDAPGGAAPGAVTAFSADGYPVDVRFSSCAESTGGGFEYRYAVSLTNNGPVTRDFVLGVETEAAGDELLPGTLSYAQVASAYAASAGEGELTAMSPDAGFDPESLDISLFTDELTYLFVTEASAVIEEDCQRCHRVNGVAHFTPLRYELGDPLGNLAVLQAYAESEPAAETTLLRKPQGLDSHGGGAVLDPESDEFAAWESFVELLTGGSSTADYLVGVELLDETATLRKATIVLAGRAPTAAERDAVTSAPEEEKDAVLRATIRGALVGGGFESFLHEGANDRLLTQKIRRTSLGELIGGDFYYPAAYDRAGSDMEPVIGAYDETRQGLVEEPLELIIHVVTNDLPYTEILTADYVMMNPYSDVVFQGGLVFDDVDDPDEWRPGSVNGLQRLEHPLLNPFTCTSPDPYYGGLCPVPTEFFPAGLLTSNAFLNRYPSTATNRNRARSRWAYEFFLGVDIESTASRLELDDLTDTDNPTLNNRACAVCHERLDPVAGAFQDHGDIGIYKESIGGLDAIHFEHKQCFLDPGDTSELCVALREECADDPYELGDTWYCDMRPPGFIRSGDAVATNWDPESGLTSLEWLGQEMTADPRFASGTVRFWFRPLLGRDPLEEPAEPADPGYAAALAAWQWEVEEIDRLADAFATDLSGHGAFNARDLLVELVMSPLFRASRLQSADPARDAELAPLGMGRLLTPEQLERKLEALVGTDWPWYPGGPGGQLTERFLLLYGGIDSDGVTERSYETTSLMAAVADTLANEAACPAVVDDFARPLAERLLFPHVEPQTTPHTMARAEQALASDWDGQASPPAPEELRLFVTLAPGTHRVLLLSPASFCDFQQGSCLDERWVIGDRLEVLGPAGGSVETLELEDADTAPGGIVSPSHGFASTSPYGPAGQGRQLSIGGYAGFELEVTQAGVHEVVAWVWGRQGGTGAPRAVVVVEDPAGEASSAGTAAIRENLVHLHRQLLGEELDAEDPEIDATLALFQDLWTARRGEVRAPFFWNENEACRLFDFSFSGQLDANSADALHAMRSWQAVLTALLADYRFLHE